MQSIVTLNKVDYRDNGNWKLLFRVYGLWSPLNKQNIGLTYRDNGKENGTTAQGLGVMVPLKWIEYGFGYRLIRSPHTSYHIYLRGTISMMSSSDMPANP